MTVTPSIITIQAITAAAAVDAIADSLLLMVDVRVNGLLTSPQLFDVVAATDTIHIAALESDLLSVHSSKSPQLLVMTLVGDSVVLNKSS